MEQEKTNVDNKKKIIKDDEIDLFEVTKTIWEGRNQILKITGVFFVIGLIIAFGSKVEYEASCKLLPESQEDMKSNLGGLGSLAGLAGINLDMGSAGALTPELYPLIAKSSPYILKVWNEPIRFQKHDTTISSYNYFKKIDKATLSSLIAKYTIELPFRIKAWLSKSSVEIQVSRDSGKIINLNRLDTRLLKKFKERISVEVDNSTGIITLSVEMPDALASAQLAQLCTDLLTKYITDYKVKKAKENLTFIQSQFSEAKTNFVNTQEALARFNDRNRNFATALAQAESQRLQNEYDLAFDVYKGLATQLEQIKIKVKDETPIFTVLEPVKIPVNKKRPKRMLILMLSIMIGLIVGSSLIFIKQYIKSLRQSGN